MPQAVQDIAPILASLLVILSAVTIAPAQLAARSALRQIVGGPSARFRAQATVLGVGVGAGLAAVMAGVMIGPPAALAVALLLLLVLLAAIDFTWRWLPWEWCGLIASLGLVQAILTGSYPEMVLGALVGGGLLLALRTAYFVMRGIEALGLGDVWLAAALGCVVGPFYIIWVLGAAAGLGLLLHFAAEAGRASERGVAFGAHICIVTPFFLGL